MCEFHYHKLLFLHTNCWAFLCRIRTHGTLFYLCTFVWPLPQCDLSYSVTYLLSTFHIPLSSTVPTQINRFCDAWNLTLCVRTFHFSTLRITGIHSHCCSKVLVFLDFDSVRKLPHFDVTKIILTNICQPIRCHILESITIPNCCRESHRSHILLMISHNAL